MITSSQDLCVANFVFSIEEKHLFHYPNSVLANGKTAFEILHIPAYVVFSDWSVFAIDCLVS